ncbi:MAG: cyclic nucleotide-binding protein, partial [Thiobacillaceae bacterium]
MSSVRNHLDWLLQVLYTTLRLYTRNGLANHAAATAFYFLLSATPLLLLLSYAMQWLAKLAETSAPTTILLAALYEQYRLDTLAEMG